MVMAMIINPVRFGAISGAGEVKILNVSFNIPILNKVKTIASIFHLFIHHFFLGVFSFQVAYLRYIIASVNEAYY
jgi:hypothetical protein